MHASLRSHGQSLRELHSLLVEHLPRGTNAALQKLVAQQDVNLHKQRCFAQASDRDRQAQRVQKAQDLESLSRGEGGGGLWGGGVLWHWLVQCSSFWVLWGGGLNQILRQEFMDTQTFLTATTLSENASFKVVWESLGPTWGAQICRSNHSPCALAEARRWFFILGGRFCGIFATFFGPTK